MKIVYTIAGTYRAVGMERVLADKVSFFAYAPYTNTISARYYKDGSEILIEQEGKNPRKLTPREAARLQGFPDNFIIPVSDTQAYK